mmetsp:Transcript_25185/g.57134  ORF Transcript_25185/g.57134 Transcript_25185/m.57134 type:complete len:145 (-) Transcript_25185:262-696(-)
MVDLFRLAALLAVCRWKPSQAACAGGDLASCHCLLSCHIFGGRTDRCDDRDMNQLVGRVVGGMLKQIGTDAECEGMQCVVGCASKLGCYSEVLRSKCGQVLVDHPGCPIDCSAAHPAAGSQVRLLASVFAAVALGTGFGMLRGS